MSWAALPNRESRRSAQSVLPTLAILCALPWIFALLLVDLSAGFADRVALIVYLDPYANAVPVVVAYCGGD